MQRQLEYHQQQRARQQITRRWSPAADWELPPGTARAAEPPRVGAGRDGTAAQRLQRGRNSGPRERAAAEQRGVDTARALKEHFILERIAEEEKIEDEPSDYEEEIVLIAAQSGESARRVRAQLEKRGLMDVLRNQIIERKVIELVLKQAKFKDEPYEPEGERRRKRSTRRPAAGKPRKPFPRRKQAGEAEPLREPQERA